MLSTQYRLRLEEICRRIVKKESVELSDIIWAEKLANSNTTARTWLSQARRASEGDIAPGSLDDFMNRMGLGGHGSDGRGISGFNGADEILDWFKQDKPEDWRQRD